MECSTKKGGPIVKPSYHGRQFFSGLEYFITGHNCDSCAFYNITLAKEYVCMLTCVTYGGEDTSLCTCMPSLH